MAEDVSAEGGYHLFDNTTDPFDLEDEIERLQDLLYSVEEKDEM